MILHSDIEQGSQEWLSLRCGIPTSSEFKKIMTPATERKAKWDKYLYTLAGERISGVPAVSFESQWMTRGSELEAEARNIYSMENEVDVEQVGFITSDDGKMGCSPDGIMDRKGLEIKCPSMHVHVEYLLKKELPHDYKLQVQGSMLVTGFSEWDFFSYYPNMPKLIITVKRDAKFLAKLKVLIDEFNEKLEETVERLKKLS